MIFKIMQLTSLVVWAALIAVMVREIGRHADQNSVIGTICRVLCSPGGSKLFVLAGVLWLIASLCS